MLVLGARVTELHKTDRKDFSYARTKPKGGDGTSLEWKADQGNPDEIAMPSIRAELIAASSS